MSYVIYCYTSPSGKKYIGQTCQTLKGRSGSRGQQYHASTKFYNAINKYGFQNFKCEILESNLSKEEADKQEIYYIDLFDTCNNGYNIQRGGTFNPADICSIPVICINCETKEIEQFESITSGARAKNLNRRSVNKVVNHEDNHYTMGGFVWVSVDEWLQSSEEEKQYYLLLQPKPRNKMRAVIRLNDKKVFNSLKEAKEETGINNISACCRGKISHAGLFNGEYCNWQYYDEYLEGVA